MYDSNNFIEYDDADLEYDHIVLLWSVKTGYFFTEYRNVQDDQKIVAREK